MLSMKKLFLVLISLIFITTVGCSSTSVESSSPSIEKSNSIENQEKELPSGLYYENKLTEEKLLIDDWKYKGFGNELPVWVIPALEENVSKLKKAVPELANAQVIILQTEGYNHDQAEKSLEEIEQMQKPEGYIKYDSFWVRAYPYDPRTERTMPKRYISVEVYYKLFNTN